MLTKKDKEDIKDIVVDVIEDVVMPAFELVATKTELREVEGRLENRLEQIDRKLDVFSDKVVVQGSELVDHQKRLKKLEDSRLVA